jgi:t-SNARE complex subunit (syntaxin)
MTMPIQKPNAMRAMGHNREVENRLAQMSKVTEAMGELVGVVAELREQVANLENRVAELEGRRD